jgi:hypothetical protein
MTIGGHAETFVGLPVEDYVPDEGIRNPEGAVYRVSVGYDEGESGTTIGVRLGQFFSDSQVSRIPGIVIGAWHSEWDEPATAAAEGLVSVRDKVPKLRGIFMGDITSEECEISWIQQTDVSPLLDAYPKLEHLRVRGGNGLSLGSLAHANLKSLIVETGGLPVSVVREVCSARLPQLEHLELWLGSDSYGWDGSVDDLQPILSGKLFPKLEYLGLRDCEIADDLAAVLANAPVARTIRTLDLSLGNLSDAGFHALCMLPRDGRLEKLDVHHHFASAKFIIELQRLPFEVDVSDVQKTQAWGGQEHRFIAVSE